MSRIEWRRPKGVSSSRPGPIHERRSTPHRSNGSRLPSPARPSGYAIGVPAPIHVTSVPCRSIDDDRGMAISTRPWATWRKSSVSSLSRLARVSDVRVVMTLRADGDEELLAAQRAFHLAAGVDAVVEMSG